ncbi:MAG: hypothetical protein GY777_16550 [Candidatus Brocadiaceae bacterium]|nr:hypothetical protein [Candidatus Brocadiaceae bacterium]
MVDDNNEESHGALEICKFADDLPHLTEAEINDKKDSHEWYYFDLQTEEGECLVVRYIIKDTSIDDINPSISLEFTTKTDATDIERIKVYHRKDLKREDMDNDEGVIIKIDTNLVKIYKDKDNNIEKYELFLKFDEFEMELECIPVHHGFKLHNNRSYCIEKDNNDIYVRVVFPAPRMKINGKLVIDQSQIELNGEGYHDHPWGTTSLIYSIKKWHWGRIYTKEFTVFFTKVFPTNGYNGKLDVLYFAKTGTSKPKLENNVEITPEKWKRKFMWEIPFMIKFPRELSINSLNENLSLRTKFIEILIIIKVYIRIKVDASVTENNNHLSGTGWVEYLKIPSGYLLQKIIMFFTKKKYSSDMWRKKQVYEHLLSEN